MAEASPLYCPICRVGILRPKPVSYIESRGGYLISVPNFPAQVCDLCRHCEYPELAELHAILSTEDRRVPTGAQPGLDLPGPTLDR